MIGRTLGIYIATKFTKTVLAMMVSLILVIVLIDFIEQVRKGSDFPDVKIVELLTISILKTPIFMDKAFPFACLFAAMITLTQLNQRMELVVARAAGISAWQFLAPISIAAVLIGLAAAFAYNPLAVAAFEKSKDWEVWAFTHKVRQHKTEISAYWIKQDDGEGVAIINAGIARAKGTQLDDVRVLRLDANGGIRERIDAQSMQYDNDKWIITGATITSPDALSRTSERYELPTNLTADIIDGATASPDSVPFWELRNVAAKAALSGNNPNPYLVQFYSLLALPLFFVAMVMIAATVSLRFTRFGQLGGLVLGGILSGFLLYTFTQLVTSLGSNGIVPPAIAAWSPSMVAILFGFGILLNQEDG